MVDKVSIQTRLLKPIRDSYLALASESDTQYFRKVHRLIDLIEVLCKVYTVCSVATFLDVLRLRLDRNDNIVSDDSFAKIKVMLTAGLQSPSLGIWWKFARDITAVLKELEIPHILDGAVEELLNRDSPIRTAYESDDNLIAFRNMYAHGATPSEAQCRTDYNRVLPIVEKLLQETISLCSVELIVCTEDGRTIQVIGHKMIETDIDLQAVPGHVYIRSSSNIIDVYPLLFFRFLDGNIDFFFYNSLKDKFAHYLNYPHAEHFKDSYLRRQLLEYIPIHEWKRHEKVDMDPFRQQVEMLTEVFKGRKTELINIANFISSEPNGFLCIWGSPGVGKSALLAKCVQVLRMHTNLRMDIEDADHWPLGPVHLLEFFIRRGASDTSPQFFNSINQRLDNLFKLKVELGKTNSERSLYFQTRLDLISKKMSENERLVVIVDGLDEITPNDDLLSLLPKLLPDRIFILYGARPKLELKFTFYEQLDRDHRHQFDLGGLSIAEIRSVLMEHVSKYDMHQKYVEDVAKVSEGNPLYLRMLCRGLEQKYYSVNQAHTLPSGMDELYSMALLRLENEYPGSIKFLVYFASAKDFVPIELVAQWLQLDTPYVRNHFLYACLEYLYDNPATESSEDFQLFHESLREYLKGKYPELMTQCQERICNWSISWRSSTGDISLSTDALNYAMRYATDHLYESYRNHNNVLQNSTALKRADEILKLVDDKDWRSLNFVTTGNGESLGRGYYYMQKILSEDDNDGHSKKKVFEYALMRHLEPKRLLIKQREMMIQPIVRDKLVTHIERIPQLANIGTRPTEKVLYALLTLWANEPDIDNELNMNTTKTIETWLELSQSSALNKLWAFTKNRWEVKK